MKALAVLYSAYSTLLLYLGMCSGTGFGFQVAWTHDCTGFVKVFIGLLSAFLAFFGGFRAVPSHFISLTFTP